MDLVQYDGNSLKPIAFQTLLMSARMILSGTRSQPPDDDKDQFENEFNIESEILKFKLL